MNFSKRVMAAVLTLMILVGSFSVTAFASSGRILYGIGFVNADALNLRQEPSVGSPILATAGSKECVVVIAQEGEWFHVIYNLQEGYMNAAYLNVSTVENAELGYGSVNGSAVNLRSGPSVNHSQVGTASLGEKCYILGLNQGWFKVQCNGTTCYIRSDFLDLTEIPYENKASQNTPKYFRTGVSIGSAPVSAPAAAPTGEAAYAGVGSTPSYASGSVSGSQIAEKAKQYLGTPYVFGGASPSGFDCSGFVYYVTGTFGISVDRTPAGQSGAGYAVSKANLQPGDIVLFAGTGGSGITHSGIYVGNGQFIHSPNSRSTVSYSSLESGYWAEHYYTARRVV